jgi:hypothetical protein
MTAAARLKRVLYVLLILAVAASPATADLLIAAGVR